MKKITILIATFLFAALCADAQTSQTQQPKPKVLPSLTTTVSNFKDTTTGFTYPSMFVGASAVNVVATTQGYRVAFRLAFYASEAFYKAGKEYILQRNIVLVAPKYPSEADIKTAFLTMFK